MSSNNKTLKNRQRAKSTGSDAAAADMASVETRMSRIEALVNVARDANATTSDGKVANEGPLVSIVVPVYNEEKTISQVVERLGKLPFRKEIIIVDDGSSDTTPQLLREVEKQPGIVLIAKSKNEGKGAALRTAFERCSGDYVVVQDADLEYDPSDIPAVLLPLMADRVDVVFGSRYLTEQHHDKSLIHRLGNSALTTASNLFNGVTLTDMETCYKAFRRSAIQGLPIKQNRFGIEPEITAKLARRGYRIAEVPISYRARGYCDGKKIGFWDLLKTIYCIVRYGVCD